MIAYMTSVLALEFVEKLDDALYLLLKKGFFGKRLRTASYTSHSYLPPGDETTNNFSKRYAAILLPYYALWPFLSYRFHDVNYPRVRTFIRVAYFFNAIVMLVGVSIIMRDQYDGQFRCKSISVNIAGKMHRNAIQKYFLSTQTYYFCP